MKHPYQITILFLLPFFLNSQNNCEHQIIKNASGNIVEEGCYINLKREGVWKKYNDDGWLRFEWTYKNNLKNGPYRAYFQSGKLNAIGNYSNGSVSDTLTVFNEIGEIVSKTLWKSLQNKTSVIVWQKLYSPDAKPDGTIDTINGKRYSWNLGEKHELK